MGSVCAAPIKRENFLGPSRYPLPYILSLPILPCWYIDVLPNSFLDLGISCSIIHTPYFCALLVTFPSSFFGRLVVFCSVTRD
ncbi:hypothetical protein EV363DRAFT_1329553 [Boletus edulis]|uniref:Uncharacterized protein n=1 Tax=Boletus edulis BED1 TaxID=1328754 RepID=A0AAD4G686_BOLED|nr:hypothetical protein EV363DRAFT_1329553 [Boletus edulis]KAF8420563.1 hypothetical protein L210DRAFT_3574480 [Boletus edulis BED1]